MLQNVSSNAFYLSNWKILMLGIWLWTVHAEFCGKWKTKLLYSGQIPASTNGCLLSNVCLYTPLHPRSERSGRYETPGPIKQRRRCNVKEYIAKRSNQVQKVHRDILPSTLPDRPRYLVEPATLGLKVKPSIDLLWNPFLTEKIKLWQNSKQAKEAFKELIAVYFQSSLTSQHQASKGNLHKTYHLFSLFSNN